MIRESQFGGFTLVELLVAIAVFLFILSLVFSLTSSTVNVTGASQRRIAAEAELRGSLDRIFADFSDAVIRPDLPPYFVKYGDVGTPANDEMYFYVRADGYTGDRGISVIGYRISTNGLERGAQGTGWTNNQMAFYGSLTNSPLVTNSGSNDLFDTVGRHVLRLETEYMLLNGSVTNALPSTNWSDISAVVVNLATIDEKSLLKTMKTREKTLAELAALLPDAQQGQRVMAAWTEKLNAPDFLQSDAAVRSGLRVKHRVIPLRK